MVSAVGEKEVLPEEVPDSLKLLFEEWLDELTEEARQILTQNPDLSIKRLAKHLRISPEGAEYIRKRLQKI